MQYKIFTIFKNFSVRKSNENDFAYACCVGS